LRIVGSFVGAGVGSGCGWCSEHDAATPYATRVQRFFEQG
jgi:hypothetical protein